MSKDTIALIVLAACALLVTSFAALALPPPGTSEWEDQFTGNRLTNSRWAVVNGFNPGNIAGNHRSYAQPDRVSVSGGNLVILLTQENGPVDGNPNGVISRGGAIYTKRTSGYGTYEWRMRMSSTAASPTAAGNSVSGSVSAGFIYVNNSQTEIDMEFSGHAPDTLFMTNWLNPNPAADPSPSNATSSMVTVSGISSAFKTYRFVWAPGSIAFYVNDAPQTAHTSNVPTAPAYFMINHWGANNQWFGGLATIGTPRYFYVDWAKYTPL
ncbi:MAG: glycoside hydrolase family 16 protein [Longimicrobiales bacterium]